MNEIDEQIRSALNAEDAEMLSKYESDESLPSMMVKLYQGRRWWINLSATVVTFVIFGVQIWCGFKFFGAETTRELIAWATGFLTLFLWIAMMKIWFWLELLRNSVTREVKRLELQVALLNQSKSE
ncbi:MAG: DUF6768 family protein [Planctomycetota bacterium]